MPKRSVPLILLLLFSAVARAETSLPVAPKVLKAAWRYAPAASLDQRPDHWSDTPLPCVTANPESKAVWFKFRVPTNTSETQALYIRAMGRPFRVFSGDQLIYSFGFEHSTPITKFLGFPWHMISLPATTPGQELLFEALPGQPKSGFCSEMYLGSSASMTAKLATDGLSRGLVALFAVLCGIAGIAVFVATRTPSPYLSFAGYSFALGGWVFSSTSGPAAKLFLLNSPRFWAALDLGGLYLTPVFLAAFFRQIVKQRTSGLRVLHWIQTAHFAFAAIVLPLGIFDVINLGRTLGPYNRIIPLFLIVLTIEALRRVRKGAKEERIFATGVVLFMAFGIHDFLVGSGTIAWTRHLAHLGQTCLLGALATIVVMSLRRQINEKEAYSRRAEVNARATEKARGAFHDLKTQIASLGSKINSLQMATQETRDGMMANLVRMRAILSLQLDDSIEHQKIKSATPPAASIGGVLNVVDEDFSQLAQNLGVGWDLVVPKWAYRAFAPMRASDLQRAVSNLCENAIQAASQHGSQVVVSLARVEDRVHIAIRDFGPGVSDQAWKAFEAGKIYTSKTDGNGRGLLSARSLVGAVGGSIRIHSDSSGATFTIDLPTREAPIWYLDAHASRLNHILILDDDEEIAPKVTRAFPQAKVRSFMAEEPFLAAARATPGAFLFVDYGFAGKRTGLDLIKAEGLADRAVLFSGRAHFDTELQERAVDAKVRIMPKECLISRRKDPLPRPTPIGLKSYNLTLESPTVSPANSGTSSIDPRN